MTGIYADHYRTEEARMKADERVINMAKEIYRGMPDWRTKLFHESGTSRHDFMMAANARAHELGVPPAHIGCVAQAIFALLNELDEKIQALKEEG